jgi:xanthine dehydrogenase iron-sulfur cluster and FAD-binding subunit A
VGETTPSSDGQRGADAAARSHTEQALGSGASVAEAQEILQREIAPIDDLRSTAEYRRQVAANLLRQFWNESRRGKQRT